MASETASRNDHGVFPFNQAVVWEPDANWIAASNMQRFMDDHDIGSYDELMRRSTSDIVWFWNAVIKNLDIQFYTPYERVLDLSDGFAFPKWCVGGKMNVVHNLLDKWQVDGARDRVALRWEGRRGGRAHIHVPHPRSGSKPLCQRVA